MRRFTDTIGERSSAGVNALHALRGTRVKTPTSELRAVIKFLYNQGNSITGLTRTTIVYVCEPPKFHNRFSKPAVVVYIYSVEPSCGIASCLNMAGLHTVKNIL